MTCIGTGTSIQCGGVKTSKMAKQHNLICVNINFTTQKRRQKTIGKTMACVQTCKEMVWLMVFIATCNNISIILWRCFIGGGNWRKPPTCHKSLKNFIT
jgi:hypothetical protein